MHNLAREKAKLHHHPHLLLEVNPEYHHDVDIPLGTVIAHPVTHDKLQHSSSPYAYSSNIPAHYNLEDARRYYAHENRNVVDRNSDGTDGLISGNRNEEKEFNQSKLYQDNLPENAIFIKNSTTQEDVEPVKTRPDNITSLHEANSNEPLLTALKNDDPIPHVQRIGSNVTDTQAHITNQKPKTNESCVYQDDEFFDDDSEEFIDDNRDEIEYSKIKNSSQSLLNVEVNNETYPKELNSTDPRIGSSQTSQTPSQTNKEVNTPNRAKQDSNLNFIDSSSTCMPNEGTTFTTTTPLNTITQNPHLNEETVKPTESTSEQTTIGTNRNHFRINSNTKPENKLNDDQLDKVLNEDLDMLSLLAVTHAKDDPNYTEKPNSFLQNFDTLQNYTKMPLEVFLPEENRLNPNQNEANPIVMNDLIEKNKYLDYRKPSSSSGELQSRLIEQDHQYPAPTNINNARSELNPQNTNQQFYDTNYGGPVVHLANYDNIHPYSAMRAHQSPNNVQPNTNYEIYSKNHNFNNRFRDEQLYVWNLNNMKDNENLLQSPHSIAPSQNQFHQESKSPTTVLSSFRPNFKQYSNDQNSKPSFNRLKEYINNLHEISDKYSQTNPTMYQSKPRESTNSWQSNQPHSELVSSYLLHFPSNQMYFGERYRRELRTLNKPKLAEKERRSQLPLVSLVLDPHARLDVPKTIKNFGTVTRKSLEDKKAPIHHFSNLLASLKDVALATLKIPPQDLLIASKYKIINKNALSNEVVGSPKYSGESANSVVKDDVTKVFHKVGSMLRQSVESGQQALQHVTDVGQNARRIISSTRKSFPGLLIPYMKAPEVIKTAKGKKLTMIAPRFADVEQELSNSHEDDYVKVGNVLEALSLSHPEEKEIGTMKITIEPKSKEPKLQSRFGDTNEPEDPGYYVINNHLEGNALNSEEVHEVIDIFHTIKEIAGAKSLKNFLKNVKIQLINCTQNVTMDEDDDEAVGNYWKFTRAMVEPFMGIFQNTNKTLKSNKEKYKRSTSKRKFDDVENANFINFLTGYEMVSAINPEMYRTYFHEPLHIDHTKDVNLKEIQHEIQNADLLVVPPLISTKEEIASNDDNQKEESKK